jgi:LCCL domain
MTRALSLFAVCVASFGLAASPIQLPEKKSEKYHPAEVSIQCTDDSVLRVKVLDETLELVTKYGNLRIPASDVRQIDFATRVPPEVTSRIAALITELGHPDYATREKASAQLRQYREHAYLPLVKAAKTADPEVGRRADEAIRFIQHKMPAGIPEPREFDVVFTDNDKLTGLLKTGTLKVQTGQFGEQALRLTDVRCLKSGKGAPDDGFANAPPMPANLMGFQHQFGKEVVGSLTGPTPGTAGIWGTDIYTLDSNIPMAAVHAGVIQPGQTAVVKVRVVPSPQQFLSSTRNGVSSTGYGNYPAGGYEFVRR